MFIGCSFCFCSSCSFLWLACFDYYPYAQLDTRIWALSVQACMHHLNDDNHLFHWINLTNKLKFVRNRFKLLNFPRFGSRLLNRRMSYRLFFSPPLDFPCCSHKIIIINHLIICTYLLYWVPFQICIRQKSIGKVKRQSILIRFMHLNFATVSKTVYSSELEFAWLLNPLPIYHMNSAAWCFKLMTIAKKKWIWFDSETLCCLVVLFDLKINWIRKVFRIHRW